MVGNLCFVWPISLFLPFTRAERLDKKELQNNKHTIGNILLVCLVLLVAVSSRISAFLLVCIFNSLSCNPFLQILQSAGWGWVWGQGRNHSSGIGHVAIIVAITWLRDTLRGHWSWSFFQHCNTFGHWILDFAMGIYEIIISYWSKINCIDQL